MELNLACPACGRINELHDGPSPTEAPADGDVSICWGCRALSLYANTAAGVALRQPTAAEADELSRDPNVLQALGIMSESYTPQQANALRWGSAQ